MNGLALQLANDNESGKWHATSTPRAFTAHLLDSFLVSLSSTAAEHGSKHGPSAHRTSAKLAAATTAAAAAAAESLGRQQAHARLAVWSQLRKQAGVQHWLENVYDGEWCISGHCRRSKSVCSVSG
jgi:hypothetical protein